MHPAARRLVDDGLIAVLRLESFEAVLPVAEALVTGGVTNLEVTATVPRAEAALTQLQTHLGDDVLLGAGSVLDAPMARRMIDAGAAFVVSPVSARDVITATQEAGAAVVPGLVRRPRRSGSPCSRSSCRGCWPCGRPRGSGCSRRHGTGTTRPALPVRCRGLAPPDSRVARLHESPG